MEQNARIKRLLVVMALLALLIYTSYAYRNTVDTLTYAVYPYLPDSEYYQELIEQRWAEVEPQIKLVRADWDCYYDDAPENIDVVMYDCVMRDKLIDSGWIQPIDSDSILDAGDIFPFALEGVISDGKMYGIPVFLCGNFLIYDRECEALAKAEYITDLDGESELLLISSDDSRERIQYTREALADTTGEANPPDDVSTESVEEIMALIDRLAIDKHTEDQSDQLAKAYESGEGMGYISFSETMRLLEKRFPQTDIKMIGFSDDLNLPRLYEDAVAVTEGVDGVRYEKCLELMNIIADADILSQLSVQEGNPQYLLLARKSLYKKLADQFPLYEKLEELVSDENSSVIIDP